jgi:hypothetical protein
LDSHQPDSTSLIGTAPFTGGADGHFRCKAPSPGSADLLVLISFDCASYPLDQHFRFAIHTSEEKSYTFPNFRFQESPPGIRVGPWPGWRNIPLMPDASIQAGERQIRLEFQFWGDESQRHLVRGIARLGTFQAHEIVLHVSDARLIPVEAQFFSIPVLRPAPASLTIPDSLLRHHPRLLINASDVESLRGDESNRKSSIDRVRDLLDRWDHTLTVSPESKIPSGPESLAPEDRVLAGAFLALLDPSASNIDRGIKSFADYVDLTARPEFEPLKIDTQSGEVLFLLCIGYDWFYHDLSEPQRQLIRARLWEIADICWNHLGYERTDYAQAHYLGCGMGLLAFSLLFWNEHPRAHEWGNHLAGVLRLNLSLLPPDGFFSHGINLWIYEFGFLLRWLELLRTGGDLDLWGDGGKLKNASHFRGAATSPDGLYGVTFGDPQFRVGGDSWCHYLIALRTGSGQARALGDFLRDMPVEGVDFRNAPARRRVYECIWYPEHVLPESFQPGSQMFADGSQFFCRKQKTMFTFRAGAPLGYHRYNSGIPGGYGHSDPCSGSFLIFANESLMVSGPGPVYRRDTALHNVVTINGRGQIGDSAVWMPDFVPPSLLSLRPEFRSSGDLLSVSVDLAQSYLPDLGVRSLRRSILVNPHRFVVGVDLVELEKESSIEWNLHSWGRFTQIEHASGLAFSISSEDSNPAKLLCHCSHQAVWKTGLSGFVPAYPNDGRRDAFLQISAKGQRAAFFWCILFSGDFPTFAQLSPSRGSWAFKDGMPLIFDGMWISHAGAK